MCWFYTRQILFAGTSKPNRLQSIQNRSNLTFICGYFRTKDRKIPIFSGCWVCNAYSAIREESISCWSCPFQTNNPSMLHLRADSICSSPVCRKTLQPGQDWDPPLFLQSQTIIYLLQNRFMDCLWAGSRCLVLRQSDTSKNITEAAMDTPAAAGKAALDFRPTRLLQHQWPPIPRWVHQITTYQRPGSVQRNASSTKKNPIWFYSAPASLLALFSQMNLWKCKVFIIKTFPCRQTPVREWASRQQKMPC